ncbi:MAG: MFS transporter [Oscillospiraceae bacterium]|jgi:OPA family glycerol-3-phosphate transporter-like MFS transporter|nr:MFS transporter [Oscillospiraceae bacterium]
MTNELPPQKLAKPRQVRGFIALAWFVYFASYLTRQNYAAAIMPMLEELQISKSLLSLPGVGGFAAYGAGQLLCGLLLRKIPARRMILTGLPLSAGCNLLLCLASLHFRLPELPWMMLALWCVNGLAQAMLWPSLVQIMAQLLSAADYRRACVQVTAASAFGTAAVYLLVPASVTWLHSWRWAFAFCAAAALAAALLWGAALPKGAGEKAVDKTVLPEAARRVRPGRLLLGFGLPPILLAVVLHGALRDGASAWMPVLVSEGFPGFSAAKSVLTAAVLPLFAALSIHAAGWAQRKIQNELHAAVLFFGIGFAAAAVLPLLLRRSLPLSVALMALLVSAMHGVNLMLVCQLPARFARFGCVGAAAGLINAFTYVGSALSMFGIALLSERFGWRHTAAVWALLALLGGSICLFATKKAHNILQLHKK